MAWTTRVSNPVWSPRFRVSVSVSSQLSAFASGVPPDIYVFHHYTRYSNNLSRTQAQQYRMHFQGWALGFHTRLTKPPTPALRPIIPSNARIPRLTAAAGTKLADPYSYGTFIFLFPYNRALRTEVLHHSRGVAASGFRPLRNIPYCCLP